MPNARIRGQQIDLDYCDRNPYRLVMQGLATIVRVAKSDDLKYALDAGEWLVEYGERLMTAKAMEKPATKAMGTTSRNQIIAELRGLYAKALGDGGLIVETQAESPEAAEPISQRTARD